MEVSKKPRLDLAKKTLPEALFRSLVFLFEQGLQDCMLVGGTALAGFYAGHRKSDDLDLFVAHPQAFKATILAVMALKQKDIELEEGIKTPQYYRTTCQAQDHSFTVDVVLDPGFFEVGSYIQLKNKVCVATLETLLMTKIATLVSRCSEKDLYDLVWLFRECHLNDWHALIDLGRKIDSGVQIESILLSILGTEPKASACGFAESFGTPRKKVLEAIIRFKNKMSADLANLAQKEPNLSIPLRDLKKLLRQIKKTQ